MNTVEGDDYRLDFDFHNFKRTNQQVDKNDDEENVDDEETTIKTVTDTVDEVDEVEDHTITIYEPLPKVKDGSGYIQKDRETKHPSKLSDSLGDENTEAKNYKENAMSFNRKIFSRKKIERKAMKIR